MPESPTDNFDFALIGESAGYNSARDKTTLNNKFMIRGSRNVYKTVRGTIASRPGLKRRGSADSTDAGVKSSSEWVTSKGSTRPFRIANGKLQVESDIVTADTFVWYELFATGSPSTSLATTYTRWTWATWWHPDEKKDRSVAVRGDDKIFHWSGGMALVSSGAAATITKQGTSSWAEAGFATQIAGEKKIMIDGTEYTYTGGETTTTLTGVSPSAAALVSGQVAIQSVIVADDEPVDGFTADIIEVLNNQIIVASYSSRLVYVSANRVADGLFDFENSGSHVFGNPELITLDNLVKGIKAKAGKAYAFAGNSDLYVITLNDPVPVSFTDAVDGQARYIQPKVEKTNLPTLNAALGQEFIDSFGEDLVWIDQKNQLRSLASVINITNPIPAHLSLPVQEEMAEDDFTGGHLRTINDTIYITAPNNGRDWMYTIRQTLTEDGGITYEKTWQPPQIRGISRFAVIDGIIYGHSNTQPQIYQVWDTAQWYDDNPNNEAIPYTSVARFAYRSLDKRYKKNTFDKYYIEGYMPNGVELLANILFEYQGAESVQAKIINNSDNPARFWLGNPYPSLGDSSLGDNPLGEGILPEGGEQETVPKFRKILDVNPVNSFEHTIEVYSNTADSRWELLDIGPNATEADELSTYLRG